ncbi:MAG TPA: putative toxin-antitoxin system toxin component, PIN family, partial [Candidatus Cybelea sp.]
ISADSAPRKLLLRWLAGEFELLASPGLLEELERVLLRAKFRAYASEEEARRFVAIIRDLASISPDPPAQPGLTADPHDDYLVALARSTRAGILVSGDRHLLELVEPEPPVLSPRACLTHLDGLSGP